MGYTLELFEVSYRLVLINAIITELDTFENSNNVTFVKDIRIATIHCAAHKLHFIVALVLSALGELCRPSYVDEDLVL